MGDETYYTVRRNYHLNLMRQMDRYSAGISFNQMGLLDRGNNLVFVPLDYGGW